MPLELTETKPQTEVRTHPETGVEVTFRRVGYIERMKLLATSGNIGGIIEALAQPGVGVVKWKGVTRRQKIGDKQGEPVHVPYSIALYEAVAEQNKVFAGWFNDQLLAINGIGAELVEGDEEGAAEGNDAEPSPSMTG